MKLAFILSRELVEVTVYTVLEVTVYTLKLSMLSNRLVIMHHEPIQLELDMNTIR